MVTDRSLSEMEALLSSLGDEIEDADEETFYLFSQSQPSRSLGMVDGRAAELDIAIGNRGFSIKQSPGVLQSTREGGTTGAAVWECSVRLAEWLGSTKNPLFAHGMLEHDSAALELGAGISGLVPLMLGPQVERMVVTDQQYALGLLKENLEANEQMKWKGRKGGKTPKSNIEVLALDWETDDIGSAFRSQGLHAPFDIVLACDCVFNYALIQPLIQTCLEVCRHGRDGNAAEDAAVGRPAVCLVAQQLRQPDVFQQWLEAFMKAFRVWRIPDQWLTEQLKEGSGFVVHVAVLR